MTAKEVLELEYATRCQHELLGRNAGYGRFMQVENIRNLAQNQRAHRYLAMLKELFLALDNGLRYPQDGVKALLHVLDHPARLLQLLR